MTGSLATSVTFAVRRLRSQRGFVLTEALVGMALIAIVAIVSSEMMISHFRSERQLRDRTMLIDNADALKTWLNSKLQAADLPLPGTSAGLAGPGNTYSSLEFTANGQCYILQLDATTKNVYAQQGSDCSQANAAPKKTIAQWVQNTTTSVDPLFQFYANFGDSTPITPAPDNTNDSANQAHVIVINLRVNRPYDFVNQDYIRTMTMNLGGAFVAGDLPDNSVTTNKIVDGAVTSSKIADGSVSGTKLAAGAVTADKMDTNARTSFTSIPITAAATTQWSQQSGDGWAAPATADAYRRTALTFADYCVAGKTLQARAAFMIYNNSGTALGLQTRLSELQMDGTTVQSASFLQSAVPGGTNVPANGYATITTSWVTIDSGTCTAPGLSTSYLMMPQVQVTSPTGSAQSFYVPAVSVQLKYS